MAVITTACAYICISNRTTFPIIYFFWFKIIADVLMFYLWYNLHHYQFYYYYNLGLRKRILFSSAIGIDLLLFVFIQIPIALWVS